MQGGQLAKYRTITMLFLHKSFFAQALLEHPENPLLSRYAPSFLATSSCASAIVNNAVFRYSKFPQLCLRSGFDFVSTQRNSCCLNQNVDVLESFIFRRGKLNPSGGGANLYKFFKIILGSIVTRAPSSPMAPSAFLEMGIAVDLFTKGVEHSLRAQKAMVRPT